MENGEHRSSEHPESRSNPKAKIRGKQNLPRSEDQGWPEILDKILGGVGTISLAVFGVLYSSHFLVAVWFAAASIICLVLALDVFASRKLWSLKSRKALIKISAGVIFVTVALAACISYMTYVHGPFAVQISSALHRMGFVSHGGIWILYEVPLAGAFASPSDVEIYLRITNREKESAMIGHLAVEIETVDNRWMKLIHIDPRLGKLCFVPGDPRFAQLIVLSRSLDAILDNRQIGPAETVQGVLFFEYPNNPTQAKPDPRYHITIADVVGHAGTVTTAPGTGVPKNTDPMQYSMGIDLDGNVFDFSPFRHKHFDDPPRLSRNP